MRSEAGCSHSQFQCQVKRPRSATSLLLCGLFKHTSAGELSRHYVMHLRAFCLLLNELWEVRLFRDGRKRHRNAGLLILECFLSLDWHFYQGVSALNQHFQYHKSASRVYYLCQVLDDQPRNHHSTVYQLHLNVFANVHTQAQAIDKYLTNRPWPELKTPFHYLKDDQLIFWVFDQIQIRNHNQGFPIDHLFSQAWLSSFL